MKHDFKETRDTYWKYYISLEKQFLETERYVEFDCINNRNTYSIEFMKLFQAVCSEIDVIGKIVAQSVSDSFVPTKKTGINEWWFHVSKAFPDLTNSNYCLLEDVELQPWKDYIVIENPKKDGKKYILDNRANHKGRTPFWWNDYNSVKHDRTGKKKERRINYTRANLYNLFISFAALYSLEVLLMKQAFTEDDITINAGLESKLFNEDLPFYTKLLAVQV